MWKVKKSESRGEGVTPPHTNTHTKTYQSVTLNILYHFCVTLNKHSLNDTSTTCIHFAITCANLAVYLSAYFIIIKITQGIIYIILVIVLIVSL